MSRIDDEHIILSFVRRPSSVVHRHSYFNVKGFLYYFVDRPSSFVGRHSYFKNFLKYEGRRTTDEIIIKKMKKIKKYEGRPTKDDGRNNNNNKKMKKKIWRTTDEGRRTTFIFLCEYFSVSKDDGRRTNNKKDKKRCRAICTFPSSFVRRRLYFFSYFFIFFLFCRLSVVLRRSTFIF